MTLYTFLTHVRALTAAAYTDQPGSPCRWICTNISVAASEAAAQGDFDALDHAEAVHKHVANQLADLGHGFATSAACQVMGVNARAAESPGHPLYAPLYAGNRPLARDIRLLWLDQMIFNVERALPLPPFPSQADLAPLFQPYLET